MTVLLARNGALALQRLQIQRTCRQSFSMASKTPVLRKAAVAANNNNTAVSAVSIIKETNILGSIWGAYTRALYRSPLLTKATMAAVIFFCSDSATQYLLRNKEQQQVYKWDAVRALSGASFGVIATTWLHYWWGFLEVAVGARIPAAQYKLANVLVKVVIDQGIGAPLYIYSYYVLTNFGQRLNHAADIKQALTAWKEVNAKASNMLWPTMLQHWRVWPTVHSFNFYFTPLHHRVLVQNTVLVGWSGYLSHLNHGGLLMTPDEEVASIVRRDSIAQIRKQEQASSKLSPEDSSSSLSTTDPKLTKAMSKVLEKQ